MPQVNQSFSSYIIQQAYVILMRKR